MKSRRSACRQPLRSITEFRSARRPQPVGAIAGRWHSLIRFRPSSLSLPDLLWFVRQEALACIFPWSLLFCMVVTKHVAVPGIPRYDVILLFALGLQYALYRLGWESEREVKVIATFHILGLIMELYKTNLGCWAYPEYSWFRIGRVPIYSGFLYASVASYCCQAWRRLDLQIKRWPPAWEVIVLAGAIYGNFFTEHRLGDMRWALIPLVFLIFARTTVRIAFPGGVRSLPLALGFLGVGLAIWIAENIGTHTGAWRYPYQQHGWMMVDFGKLSSWFLLIVVTFIIVAQLKRIPKATGPVRCTQGNALGTRTRPAEPAGVALGAD